MTTQPAWELGGHTVGRMLFRAILNSYIFIRLSLPLLLELKLFGWDFTFWPSLPETDNNACMGQGMITDFVVILSGVQWLLCSFVRVVPIKVWSGWFDGTQNGTAAPGLMGPTQRCLGRGGGPKKLSLCNFGCESSSSSSNISRNAKYV